MLRGSRLSAFRWRLLAWFRAHQRVLPFRGTRDPYRIWLSEIMLQQTRVAAVLPYYEKFLKRFPTVQSLARASEQEVLKHWAGLGYYSRARNLRRAAKEIVARHGGRFPRAREAALALPGVGEYTAAAVLSIAYGEPLAVLDGNVARVLARLFAIRGELRAPGNWKKLVSIAQELLPKDGAGIGSVVAAGQGPRQLLSLRRNRSQKIQMAGVLRAPRLPRRYGEWNQAMMELGATVCTPRSPNCAACPVATMCSARKRGLIETIPPVRNKRASERISIAAAVLLDVKLRTLLVKQDAGAEGHLFSRMWQFPAIEVKQNPAEELQRHVLRILRAEAEEEKNKTQRTRRSTESAEKISRWIALPPAKHSVTYRELTLLPFLMRLREIHQCNGARVLPLQALHRLPISNATRKIAAAALAFLRQNQQEEGA